MNPFLVPQRVLVWPRPQDMRAGVHRLSALVAADFGLDPMDGSLYVFVGRDCRKAKLLRFDVNGWALTCCYLAEGTFRWSPSGGGPLEVEPRRLFWLLDGLPMEQPLAPKPVAAGAVI